MGGNCNKQPRRQSNVQQMQPVQQFPAPPQYGQFPGYGQYLGAPCGPGPVPPQSMGMPAPPPNMGQPCAPPPMSMAQQCPPPMAMQQCGPPVTVLPPIPINYTGGIANCYRPGPPMMACVQGGQANDRRMMEQEQDYASRYYAEQMPSGKSRKH